MLLVWQAARFQAAKSATYDETFYISYARRTVQLHSLDPRMAQAGVAPLPVLLCYLPAALGHPAERPTPDHGELDDPPLVRKARRIHTMLVDLPLVVLVFLWLARRRGIMAGTCAAALMVFSPTILAHTSLAGTDAKFCLAALATLAGLAFYCRRTTPGRLVLVGVLLGLALGAKYSALMLIPIVAAVVAWAESRRAAAWHGRLLDSAIGMTFVFGLALLVVWGVHGFAIAELPGPVRALPAIERLDTDEHDMELPTPIVGVLAQVAHNRRGHAAFLMEQRRSTGWWYYYPCALYFKSTPAELVLAVIGLWLGCAAIADTLRRRDQRVSGDDSDVNPADVSPTLWLASLMLLVAAAMAARIDIGQRYILLVYPLMFLLVLDRLFQRGPRRPAVVVAALLVVGQATSAIGIAPHYLAYFSPFVGGPARGYTLLVDSNLDWGQDLPALRRQLERLHARHPLLCYFGSAKPAAYGVAAELLNDHGLERLDHHDWLAVSVGWLQGVTKGCRLGGRHELTDRALAQLRNCRPDARAGYSIFLYNLRRSDVRAAIRAEARLASRGRFAPKTSHWSHSAHLVDDLASDDSRRRLGNTNTR